MKTSELIKILRKYDCYLLRHGSNHDVWYSPVTEKQFLIPRHKRELKVGTLKSIMNDAGIE